MSGCNPTLSVAAGACSGKCKSERCSSSAGVWVVAACEGRISLFAKRSDGSLSPVKQTADLPVLGSIEQFQEIMRHARDAHAFDRLVLVGSSNDVAWVHTSLPEPLAHHIAAEIKYPLLSAWFRPEEGILPLQQALEHVLRG